MAPQPYETMFCELMWQTWSRNIPFPMPQTAAGDNPQQLR
jgi:hypothetical protein